MSRSPAITGAWTALFPLTYCGHIAEEYWGGETFYGWVSRLWGVDFTREEFLTLNAIGLVVMIAGVLVSNVTPVRFPIAAFGFITIFNGTLHAVASVFTQSYSPGTISGVLVWIPLGMYALRRCSQSLSRQAFYGGIAGGVLAHAIISAVAFMAS